MIHASLENCTIWVCLKMWYPQVQRMINYQCQLAIWSAHRYSPCFINMFQWIDLKGTCPGTPDIWLVKPTRFSQGRSMHISLRQGEHRQSVVTGPYWPSNRKTLQNICKISARQHWYWHHAILYELLWALICGHTAKHTVSKLVHSSKIWRFQKNSTMHRCKRFVILWGYVDAEEPCKDHSNILKCCRQIPKDGNCSNTAMLMLASCDTRNKQGQLVLVTATGHRLQECFGLEGLAKWYQNPARSDIASFCSIPIQ